MKKIGLTGGIGSGKTMVAKIFETLGIPVYYADSAAKHLMNNDPFLRDQLVSVFGEQVYTSDGLNRAYLASVVFNDKHRLEQLNALIHPVTIQHAEEWMKNQKAPYVIKEAAILFETGSAEHLDHVIGVSAPSHVRIQRVMDRDGLTAADVKKRMDQQISESMKMKLCDYIIVNDEVELVIPQVLELHEKLLSS